MGLDGAMFALVATGHSQPWPYDAPEVGFSKITEEYFDEEWTDYQNERDEELIVVHYRHLQQMTETRSPSRSVNSCH